MPNSENGQTHSNNSSANYLQQIIRGRLLFAVFDVSFDISVVFRFGERRFVEISISHEIKEMLFRNRDIVLSLHNTEFTQCILEGAFVV